MYCDVFTCCAVARGGGGGDPVVDSAGEVDVPAIGETKYYERPVVVGKTISSEVGYHVIEVLVTVISRCWSGEVPFVSESIIHHDGDFHAMAVINRGDRLRYRMAYLPFVRGRSRWLSRLTFGLIRLINLVGTSRRRSHVLRVATKNRTHLLRRVLFVLIPRMRFWRTLFSCSRLARRRVSGPLVGARLLLDKRGGSGYRILIPIVLASRVIWRGRCRWRSRRDVIVILLHRAWIIGPLMLLSVLIWFSSSFGSPLLAPVMCRFWSW